LVRGVVDGETNTAALIIGVACLVVILAFKRWRPRIPGVLVAVVGATVAVGAFGLAQRYDLSVVGPLPKGLPSFEIPSFSVDDLQALLAGAIGIALVSFADTSVLSRTFAIRGGYRVDPNQELVALGAANVAAGFFQGFSVSSSSSRTPVAEAAGAKTQVTGLVGALAIALMLLFFPTLVQNLPDSALAAVVISAAIGLIEAEGVRKLYRVRETEFALSMVCFLGVAVLGVIEGIFIAVALALLDFIRRAWRPYDAVLGRVDDLKGYHDVTRYPDASASPAWCSSDGTRRCSSPTPRSSPTVSGRPSRRRRRRGDGRSWPPNPSPTSTPPPPTSSGSLTRNSPPRASTCASPR
jgi:MFS superfamily sulfate permease-like transporter